MHMKPRYAFRHPQVFEPYLTNAEEGTAHLPPRMDNLIWGVIQEFTDPVRAERWCGGPHPLVLGSGRQQPAPHPQITSGQLSGDEARCFFQETLVPN